MASNLELTVNGKTVTGNRAEVQLARLLTADHLHRHECLDCGRAMKCTVLCPEDTLCGGCKCKHAEVAK